MLEKNWKLAVERTKDFLENDADYRMGYVEAEQSNIKTKKFDTVIKEDAKAGVRTLFSVDRDLIKVYSDALNSDSFDRFVQDICETLKNGGRIIFSGCGSSGRLCMGAERAFRRATADAGLPELGEQTTTIMTGGDYAVIRAVEFFEDYEILSAKQVDELSVCEKDMLVGVTATAETTSVLGTAYRASQLGAKVVMVVCSDPKHLLGKMKRVDRLYTRDNVSVIYLPCGAMAITGSTRMQSSTIEQLVIMSALENALANISGTSFDKEEMLNNFEMLIDYLESDDCVEKIADYAQTESKLYENNGYVTYFTKNYMLDILTDSTERAPTFAFPSLRQQCRKDLKLSWAFAKNANLDTNSAWFDCFGRNPRCIDWDESVYRELGIEDNVPDISEKRLLEFEIGNESDPEREAQENTLGVWIDSVVPGGEFYKCVDSYKEKKELVFQIPKGSANLEIFEHIGMKMILNAISTSTAALFGRISGNYMTYLDMSNKKLIDRGTRIISELCDVSYEKALNELFYSYLCIKEKGENISPAQDAIQRIKKGSDL